MIDSFVNDFITDLISTFTNPRKRVYIGYFLSAFAIAICWMMIKQKQPLIRAIKQFFSKSVWWTNSSKLDYQILIINKIIALAISPIFLSQLGLATIIFYWLHDVFPNRPIMLENQQWLLSFAFTFTLFIFDDFTRFYVHRLMHRWPVLWAFHQVHHSAKQMTPLTIFRSHPIEMIVFSLRSTIVQALSISTFIFFAGDNISLTTILGANIFIFFFNFLGSNLRHSHIQIAYPKIIEKFFISPAQHQIHHSSAKKHYDKNFGVVLSIWDRMFNSFHHSEPSQQLQFGLQDSTMDRQKLTTQYFSPFKFAWRQFQINAKYFKLLLFKRTNSNLDSKILDSKIKP